MKKMYQKVITLDIIDISRTNLHDNICVGKSIFSLPIAVIKVERYHPLVFFHPSPYFVLKKSTSINITDKFVIKVVWKNYDASLKHFYEFNIIWNNLNKWL